VHLPQQIVHCRHVLRRQRLERSDEQLPDASNVSDGIRDPVRDITVRQACSYVA
jgi:hypothetical protein